LPKGPEALFKQFHASRRKNIRYAIKNGVEVSQAKTVEDVETFYQIHLRWRQTERKTISTSQIPWEVFERRFQHPDNFRFFLARHSGKVIAAITLRFCPGGLVEFSDHNSLDEYLHLKPNDLLQWKCIEWACGEGFRSCSLGGEHTFHRRFGGTVLPINRYRMDRTWLRRYDRHEAAMDRARVNFRKLPRPAQKVIRRILGKEEQVP
jgi:lipid II:glycine glycyltransferase (peptidoglycan interpeptide bridge formation enzyme)